MSEDAAVDTREADPIASIRNNRNNTKQHHTGGKFSNSQSPQAKNPHNLHLLPHRFLQPIQQRHRQHQDREISQGVQARNDGGPEIRIDAVMLYTELPRRIDGHALEE